MPPIALYLIKLSCSLGLVWLFYRLVLHNLTFYTWNRWYLLGYGLLSLLIPFVNIGPIGGEDPALQPLIIHYIPAIGKADTVALTAGHSFSWNCWYTFLIITGVGSCFLLTRFAIRWYSLKKMRRNAELLQERPVKIFRVSSPIAPFSFGNAIYVNPDQHGEKEWEEIILHEYVHIRQRHTIDVLVGELLVIANWYNPFAWLIRHSIRQNLEFIADRVVVENGCDKKGYQYHLLKVVGQSRYRLANNFNFSSLKKRIIMMNKMRSARLHLLRFLFVLPLLTVLLVAFRDRLPISHTPATAIRPKFRRAPQIQRALQAQSTDPQLALQTPAADPRSTLPATSTDYRFASHIEPNATHFVPQFLRIDTIPRKRDSIITGKDSLSGDEAKLLISGNIDGSIRVRLCCNPSQAAPLYIIDDKPTDSTGLSRLNPNDIESITVLQEKSGEAIYGDKGKNGVVIIKTKKPKHVQVTIETKDADGTPWTITADTITTPQGKVYARP